MDNSNPCKQLSQVRRQLNAIGAAHQALRAQFAPDDEHTPHDDAIVCSLISLEEIQLSLAKKLITANRRHDSWKNKLREEAHKQVQEEN